MEEDQEHSWKTSFNHQHADRKWNCLHQLRKLLRSWHCHFRKIASGLNYDPQFLAYKETSEHAELNFDSSNEEKYNEPLKMEELKRAIKCSKNNSPGLDDVSNLIIMSIPETALPYILSL